MLLLLFFMSIVANTIFCYNKKKKNQVHHSLKSANTFSLRVRLYSKLCQCHKVHMAVLSFVCDKIGKKILKEFTIKFIRVEIKTWNWRQIWYAKVNDCFRHWIWAANKETRMPYGMYPLIAVCRKNCKWEPKSKYACVRMWNCTV